MIKMNILEKLEMQGPFLLTRSIINEKVDQDRVGNYALGYSDGNTFCVQYVGRSDTDVKARLEQHVPEKYSRFMFSYATTQKAAFEKECRNYHDFIKIQKLDNKNHPDRPARSSWKCPCCDVFD